MGLIAWYQTNFILPIRLWLKNFPPKGLKQWVTYQDVKHWTGEKTSRSTTCPAEALFTA